MQPLGRQTMYWPRPADLIDDHRGAVRRLHTERQGNAQDFLLIALLLDQRGAREEPVSSPGPPPSGTPFGGGVGILAAKFRPWRMDEPSLRPPEFALAAAPAAPRRGFRLGLRLLRHRRQRHQDEGRRAQRDSSGTNFRQAMAMRPTPLLTA